MLLDLFEGAIDGVAVGDIALDAEQPLGRSGSAVCDGDLMAVGGEPLRDRQTDPRFPPVTSTERDTNAGLPLLAASSVAPSVTWPTYRLGASGPQTDSLRAANRTRLRIPARDFRSAVRLAGGVGVAQHTSAMTDPFWGSKALAAGALTPYAVAESLRRTAQRRVRATGCTS